MTENHLHEGTGNLERGEVILDESIPFYSVLIPNGAYHNGRYYNIGGGYYNMNRKRIIGFRNPNLIMILEAEGYFEVKTKAELLSPEDYEAKHQKFLSDLTKYGFRDSVGRVSVLQELVDRECEIFERVMSNYSLVSSN